MLDDQTVAHNRRKFLALLAGSPLLRGQDLPDVIKDPKDAINILDFEPAAKKVVPPAHWGYMATGVEDDVTLRANREGYSRIYLRPRRLIDIRKVDLRTDVMGTEWDMPIGFAPIGNYKAFHPEGELPVLRAAREKKVVQVLSTNANTSIEDASAALGRPLWFQLYAPSRLEIVEKFVKRAEAAGCGAILLTVDTQGGRRTETYQRMRLLDKRDCDSCHGVGRRNVFLRKPMFQGVDMTGVSSQNPGMTWETINLIRKMTSTKFLIKGIETHEDAKLCVEAGVDGILVSNHGGRAGESFRGTIDCLPEVVEAAGKVPVFLDGGIRRGSDVFKALALGARAVFVGRPHVWASAAFGQPGVERMIDMLRLELELVMKQCGTTSIPQISRNAIGYINKV